MATYIVLKGQPIRKTEQQHRFGGLSKTGKAIIYRDTALRAAKREIMAQLMVQRPDKPMDGPVYLTVLWFFGTRDKRKIREHYKITRPDTDNMLKLLKDCLTEAGYWNDDAQVACEYTTKTWTNLEDARTVIEIKELEPPWKEK